MSIGFFHVITFNNNGKITDYQKSYTDNYDKKLKVFLPLNYNNKKEYTIILSVSINNTFPKQIEKVIGYKDDTDLNCYIFNLSELYRKYSSLKKIGLSKLTLLNENSNRTKFQSESFRI